MSEQCYPMTVLPHISRLYADYLAMANAPADASVRLWFGSEPMTGGWMGRPVAVKDPDAVADALARQSREFGAGARALENIEKLRGGARAVVTGQQVGLFGGPLLTLLKAATAVARAKEASARTGVEHVPVFWLATEDHDLEEVDQVSLPGKNTLETIRLGLSSAPVPVGGLSLGGANLEQALDQASELLGWAPVSELLRACYTPESTLGGAFARFMATLFAEHGLIVMDAAGAEFHGLGQSTLRFAIEQAAELEQALLARTKELEADGYHAQVLVAAGHSLLFLLHEETRERQALRRTADGGWKAGGRAYTTAELLEILEKTPDRVSPNALLRPVFQDTILPVAAYIGGPAEIAYFAQSEVVYRAILGRVTPVLPRFSATLIEPAIAAVMDRHEITLSDLFTAKTAEALAQRLGARAMPIEGKRKLAAVGNAMDAELTALTEYLGAMDASLGRSATISGNKMRYQMNRLRRMAATFEVQKEASLRKHADALVLQLFPDGHPQERVLGGVWFLSRCGEGLVDRLVEEAGLMCVGHTVVRV
ncbi:bacillithiol biosynthesis cysteine-adding enzyme BshC [Granulicella sp. WH15]|uniref:bacillithiol biosynthesis cysteine-adding enzyme BshC n=1 Tax=Granulicella sp. WH15 TaxID=2602070 RepID=UPI001366B1AC|nr:bacillithiol biosynthesis cysteine-adding enzyme BshC [Granulicella sp. WH15]QHN04367.1 bacillithiol biosynthesis cysteine-adding enzyme BshC [Granulicella sp. WH15]